MEVVEFRKDGFPLYWVNTEPGRGYLKLYRRITKNCSAEVVPPPRLRAKVLEIRMKYLNNL